MAKKTSTPTTMEEKSNCKVGSTKKPTKEAKKKLNTEIVDSNNNQGQQKELTIKEFEEIVLSIVENAGKLKEYDYFGAVSVLTVIQLMLSKSDEYVKSVSNCNDNGLSQLETPEEIMEEVDTIVSTIRKKLNK